MKHTICFVIILGLLPFTLGSDSLPLMDMFDNAKNMMMTLMGGESNPISQMMEQVLNAFQFDDWEKRISSILGNNGGELSARGRRELEQVINGLKGRTDSNKEDYKQVLEKLKISE